jgi:lysophospholipase L1-like esterase
VQIPWMATAIPLIAVTLLSLALSLIVLTNSETRRALQFTLAERIGGMFAPTFVVVGDSLAANCPWRTLARRPFSVANLAVGGATIKEIAGQVYRAQRISATYLLIEGGLNDLLFDDAPLTQIENDFRALLRRIGPGKKAIVTLMPHVADASKAMRIDAANHAIARLCSEHGCVVVDLNPAISAEGKRRPEMTNDGLHFTFAAHSIWIEAVQSKISLSS